VPASVSCAGACRSEADAALSLSGEARVGHGYGSCPRMCGSDLSTRYGDMAAPESTRGRRGGLRAAWRRLDRCGEASHFVGRLIGTTMFPRLAYRLRWPSRLRGVKLAAYVAFNVLLMLSFRELAGRWARRRALVVESLRDELGREASSEDVATAFDALRRAVADA
jgi:hypothetical protein